MKRHKEFIITKASGEKAIFSNEKLRFSLARAGADENIINEIIAKINSILYNNMTTEEIYKRAFSELKKYSKVAAGKYHIKRAIMELGPSGFPFEKYISKILAFNDFSVQLNQIVNGKCVNHEVDIIAEKDKKRFLIECKYHNTLGITCNVKIPLYIDARLKDIQEVADYSNSNLKFNQAWLVTNTKFTADAIQYGTCAGLHLIGWNYPKNGSIKDMIDESSLYPITCLTSLSQKEKKLILESGIVLCSDLITDRRVLKSVGITENRMKIIIKECDDLLTTKVSIKNE